MTAEIDATLLDAAISAGLTEEHLRAILTLPESIREPALIEMAYLGLPPEQAMDYAGAVTAKLAR